MGLRWEITGVKFMDVRTQLLELNAAIKEKRWESVAASEEEQGVASEEEQGTASEEEEQGTASEEEEGVANADLESMEEHFHKTLKKQFSLDILKDIMVHRAECQYYFKGKPTGIGYGNSGDKCTDETLKCAGGASFGWIPQQGWLIKDYIKSQQS